MGKNPTPQGPKGVSTAEVGTTRGTKGSPTAEAGTTLEVGAGTGRLSNIACKVLMKIMYIARFARPDLLRAVGALSTMITKWDCLCDRKLLRIIKYINGSAGWRQIGFIGDGPEELELGLFSDADFAWG